MSIIETMKDTPSFSGIPGASQSETTIGMWPPVYLIIKKINYIDYESSTAIVPNL
jgi:hypothetical protein